MDLILLNTVLNFIWYIGTTIFLIYKFTSFFSWVYNCCGYVMKCFYSLNRIFTKYFTFKKSENVDDLDNVIENYYQNHSNKENFFKKSKGYFLSFFKKNIPDNESIYCEIGDDNISNVNYHSGIAEIVENTSLKNSISNFLIEHPFLPFAKKSKYELEKIPQTELTVFSKKPSGYSPMESENNSELYYSV